MFFQALVQGVCYLYMILETNIFLPLHDFFTVIRNRLAYGRATKGLYYRPDLQEGNYVGANGCVYTILQDGGGPKCKFNQYIYDASWTPDGKVHFDVTNILRSLCGPMGNLHGYSLSLEELGIYLASTGDDCDVLPTNGQKLTWTNARELTTFEVTDPDEVLDFMI